MHLLAVCKRALERNESVAAATERLAAQGTVQAYEEILDALLGVQDFHDASDEDDEPDVADTDAAGASPLLGTGCKGYGHPCGSGSWSL